MHGKSQTFANVIIYYSYGYRTILTIDFCPRGPAQAAELQSWSMKLCTRCCISMLIYQRKLLHRVLFTRKMRTLASMQSSQGGAADMSDAEAQRRRREVEAKYAAWKPRWPHIQTIGARELYERLKSDGHEWILVDIRTKSEQEVSMLPGALTQEQFETQIESIKGSKRVVTYCTAGYRSGEYASSLVSDHNFQSSRVYNLEGSLLSWSHEGLPLSTHVDGKAVGTTRLHVFSPSWSLEGPGYTPVLSPQPLWDVLKAFIISILHKIRRFLGMALRQN